MMKTGIVLFKFSFVVLTAYPWMSHFAFCEEKKNVLEDQLKSALVNAQQKLGTLESWQKTIYSDEIVPQYQRFIRDYKASNSGIQADIDLDSLKYYLAFYAPKALKKKDLRVLVHLKSDQNCTKCNGSAPVIQKLARARLERRGLVPVWVNPDELKSQMGGSLEDQVEALAKQKNAAGFLVVYWAPAPVDDSDTAHADEKHYIIRSTLKMGDSQVMSRQKELLETDPFEAAHAKILSDFFTDLGSKLEWEKANLSENGKEEVLIEVTGVKDFSHYTRIKTSLQNRLKDGGSLEDRILSRGQIVFGIFSNRSSEEIKKELNEMNLGAEFGQSLNVVVR